MKKEKTKAHKKQQNIKTHRQKNTTKNDKPHKEKTQKNT